jgi:Rps23 Pro-64 3,4-dihydroxylase Tpa1-like proline 4-hydroxylase
MGVADAALVEAMVKAGIDVSAANLLVSKVRGLPGYEVLERTMRKNQSLKAATALKHEPLSRHENVLPTEFITEINKYVDGQTSSRSNYSCWPKELLRSSGVVLVYDFPKEMSDKIFEHAKIIAPEISNFETNHAMYQRWMPGSYISWHSDFSWKMAVTIYLNETWDKNWGGYFAYESGAEIKCIKPEFNVASKIFLPVEHTVFTVTPDAPPRNAIQIFAK